jgi:hypothetical protein
MYGLVNKAIEDLVTTEHGSEVWDTIRREAEVDIEGFVGMTPYDDAITYRLVAAAGRVLGVPGPELLRAFGRYWIQFTARQGYGQLLDMAGRDLPSFLNQLDAMHGRVGMTYRELRPPGFRCEELDGGDLLLHYWSDRPGLAPMVIGLLEGLGDRFETPLVATLEARREDGADHDVFRIRYR